MKKILILLTLFFLTQNIFADCASHNLSVFPMGKQIYQNSWIVLGAYERSQAIISELNAKYPIFLESETHKVPLIVKETHKGQMRIEQAILQPKEKLKAGEIYRLKIENLPKQHAQYLRRYNHDKSEYEPIEWTVLEGSDTEMPKIIKKPIAIDKHYMRYGCGPEHYVTFEFDIKDQSELLIETEVTDLTTNEKAVYFLTTSYHEKNRVEVGHYMCSGAFTHPSDGNYQIRFKFYDPSGNTTGWLHPMVYNIP